MKHFITTAAVTLIATVGFAGNSTRYEDLRLDTSVTASVVHAEGAGATRPDSRHGDLRLETFARGNYPTPNLSTRSAVSSNGEGFAYGGFGEGNDSR